MNDLDWKHIAPDIVLKLKGEPKSKTSEEWRYGSKGSFVFNVSSGTVYDFELGEGGGITWLIQQHGLEIDDVLKDFGIARPVLSAPQKKVVILIWLPEVQLIKILIKSQLALV